MKRILITVVVTAMGYGLYAQPGAGKIFVGGDIGVYGYGGKTKTGGTTSDGTKTTNITVLPKAGYFLSSKLAIGAELGVDATIVNYPGNNPDKSTDVQFHVMPFARYYLISGTGGIFVEGGVGVGFGKRKTVYPTNTQETNLTSFTAGITPGVYYYVIPKLALEATFGWFGFSSSVEKDGDVKNITNSFGFNAYSTGISLGFTYTL